MIVLTILTLLVTTTAAHADGEVGVVIDENGQVRTYCVAYTGSSIAGDDLLSAAGISYEDLGTSSGSVLCAIEDTGCFDAGSFNECWCECSGSGGGNCVYWAFFTRDYGAGWVYSSRAFDRTASNDGDLHAWKWGQGGPSSAPKPSDSLTFEAVCGHAPRGGVAPQQPTSTSVATGPSSSSPPVSSSPAATSSPSDTATAAPGGSMLTPGGSVTFTAQPARTPGAVRREATDARDDDDNGVDRGLLAFGAIAVVLVALIGGAAYWRRSHGG